MDPKRLLFILGHSYSTTGARGIPVYFESMPGEGKTTIVREYANAYFGGRLKVLEMSRRQGTDLLLPVKDDSSRTVTHYPNGELSAMRDGGVVFFDELPRSSDKNALDAAMNIFLEREMDGLDLRRVHTIAAGNPAAVSGGIDLDAAFINRVVKLSWPEDGAEEFASHVSRVDPLTGRRAVLADWPAPSEGWQAAWPDAWAKAMTSVTGFLRKRPDLLREKPSEDASPWCSKRSWHTAICVLAACDLHKATGAERVELLGGVVGQRGAAAYVDWFTNANLLDPHDVVTGKASHSLARLRLDQVFVALNAAAEYVISASARGAKVDLSKFGGVLNDMKSRNAEAVALVGARLAASGALHPSLAGVFRGQVFDIVSVS